MVECALKKIFAYVLIKFLIWKFFRTDLFGKYGKCDGIPISKRSSGVVTSCWQCLKRNKEEPRIYFEVGGRNIDMVFGSAACCQGKIWPVLLTNHLLSGILELKLSLCMRRMFPRPFSCGQFSFSQLFIWGALSSCTNYWNAFKFPPSSLEENTRDKFILLCCCFFSERSFIFLDDSLICSELVGWVISDTGFCLGFLGGCLMPLLRALSGRCLQVFSSDPLRECAKSVTVTELKVLEIDMYRQQSAGVWDPSSFDKMNSMICQKNAMPVLLAVPSSAKVLKP